MVFHGCWAVWLALLLALGAEAQMSTGAAAKAAQKAAAKVKKSSKKKAEKKKSPPPPKPSAKVASNTIDLDKAVRLALKNHYDIQISEQSAREKQGSFEKADGSFDLNLSSSLAWDVDRTPTGSSLDGVSSALVQNNIITSLALSKKWITGTDLSLSYSYTSQGSNSSNARFPTTHTPSLTLGVSQPIIRSFMPSYFAKDLDKAELDWEIAKKKHGEKIVQTLIKTLQLYFDTKKAREELAIKGSAHKVSKQTYEFTRQKRKAGKASLIDLIEAESGMQKNYEALLGAEADYKNKREELAIHLFNDPQKAYELSKGIKKAIAFKSDLPLEAMIKKAVQTRLELKRANDSVEKAEIAADASVMDKLPTLTGEAELSYSGLEGTLGDSHSQVFGGDFPSWKLSLSLEQPLLMYAASGAHRSNQAKLKQEILKRQQTERNIGLEVRKNLRQVGTNWQRLVALEKVAEAETEKYKGQEIRFKNGKISNYELNQSLEDKEKALVELVKAQIGYQMANYRLAESRGTLLKTLGFR